ncbi:MAG TPA: arylsulfotransferase family protein [Thermoanaerobaculia bacterium]|nr:arylsulfotransferase family protein [Thermoanaerobaculia bacterium]
MAFAAIAARAAPPVPSEGKWSSARDAANAADIRALPYLQGYRPAQDRPTVVVRDPLAVCPGLNLYLSGHAAEAVLMDSRGRRLHRWRYPLRRLWPDLASDPNMAKLEYWRRAWLFPNGDLLAIYEGLGLVKLDARSRVLWARRGGFHHDLQVWEEGRIWVLDREGKVIPRLNPRAGVLEDFVTVIGPNGQIVRKQSIMEAFERSRFAPLLKRMERSGDVLHTNTLEVLDGRFAGLDPAFRKGNVLLSVLKLDALAVLDPVRGEIVWAKTGSWRRQHQPTFLANGRLLLFDNRGPQGELSRVIELDPRTGQVLWQFGGRPEVELFSRTLGSCQRLQNGNTLISESENGRALEVTRDGRIVWEFYNPNRVGKRKELVAVLFEMLRLPPNFPFRGIGQG